MTSGCKISEHKIGDPCWCTYAKEHPEDKDAFECTRCHSFVECGMIRYLPDSTHKYAGQTVPMEPF